MFREESDIQILLIMLKEKLLPWFADIIRVARNRNIVKSIKLRICIKESCVMARRV